MVKQSRGLLAEIEHDATDDKVPLTRILRKCIRLGGEARNVTLRDWAGKELDGYRNDNEIPNYRIIHAPLTIDGLTLTHTITGQTISSVDLPEFAREHITEEVRLAHGVGDLEALIRNTQRNNDAYVQLAPPGAAELAKLMTYQLQTQSRAVTQIYWAIHIARLEGVLDQIRNTLVRIVGEVRAAMPEDSEVPSSEAVDQAVNVVLQGGQRHQINITTAMAKDNGSATLDTGKPESWWTKTGTIWTIVGVLVAIVAVYLTYLQLGD